MSQQQHRDLGWGYGLVALWVVGFLLFWLVPLAAAVFISLTNWSPVSGPFWHAHVWASTTTSQMLLARSPLLALHTQLDRLCPGLRGDYQLSSHCPWRWC